MAGCGVSVEAAEASLGEAAFDRALVPERAGSGGEDLAPIGAMGRVAFASGGDARLDNLRLDVDSGPGRSIL